MTTKTNESCFHICSLLCILREKESHKVTQILYTKVGSDEFDSKFITSRVDSFSEGSKYPFRREQIPFQKGANTNFYKIVSLESI